MSHKVTASPDLAETVAAYLKEHRDFFESRADLLAEIQLRHDTGAAVSLIERQVAHLRQCNKALHLRMKDLLENARRNDRLIDKTRRLTFALMDANDLGDLLDALSYSLTHEFCIDFHKLILFHPRSLACNTKVVPIAEGNRILGKKLRLNSVISGGMTLKEAEFLFDDLAPSLGSAAMVVIRCPQPIAVLALGARDPSHYKANMSILFLDYIGQILERLLPELMKEAGY